MKGGFVTVVCDNAYVFVATVKEKEKQQQQQRQQREKKSHCQKCNTTIITKQKENE